MTLSCDIRERTRAVQRTFPWRVEEENGELEPRSRPAAAAAPDWKDWLRRRFEAWLESLDRIPQAEEEEVEEPDLYSFFEQLAVANTEARKANRRAAEAFSQWGEILQRFGADLGFFREQLGRLEPARAEADSLPRPYCLALVEFLDRLQRLADAFASPPAPRWWRRTDEAWRRAWDAQRGAFEILTAHLEDLLAREGITRIECLGRPFDPTLMAATAAGPDPGRPDNTVAEEFAAGYCCRGTVLRPAQVRVVNNRSAVEQP